MFPLALNHLLDMHMLRVFYSLGGSHNRVYHLEQDEAIYLWYRWQKDFCVLLGFKIDRIISWLRQKDSHFLSLHNYKN